MTGEGSCATCLWTYDTALAIFGSFPFGLAQERGTEHGVVLGGLAAVCSHCSAPVILGTSVVAAACVTAPCRSVSHEWKDAKS